MNKKTKFLAAALIAVTTLFAQKTKTFQYDAGANMRDHCLDFERLRLMVEFEPEKSLVKGKITHFFSPIRNNVDSFYLDGPGIIIKEAKLNGQIIKYKSDAEGISFFPSKKLMLGEKDSLNITYEAYPKKGIYFIGWNDPKNISRKQIWTQGQGIDNRHWFPCYDTPNDKVITEVYVKFDKEYKVLSNGAKLSDKENKDGTRTWHYKMSNPHATYLVMLGIGKYEIKESKSKSGVSLRSWYYPEWKDRFEYTYKYNEKIFDFLESEIGVPYGWESYSQIPVQDFMFGAMENTSATLFGDFFQVDSRSFNDRNYVSVNAHELAHQWFGDMVTARSPNSHWLQESFATHYNVIAERECFGEDHFDWARRTACNTTINTTDKKSISHSETPTALIYQKGSQVLEMLKYVTGREAYNRSVKRYLQDHKYRNVDSDDLLNAFQDELGMPLEWFWEEWVYRGGEPSYQVIAEDLLNQEGKRYTEFKVTQVHQTSDLISLFKMPIVFEVHYTDGSTDSKTEWIEKESHIVRIANSGNKKIDFVLFDPNSEIMKTVVFNKPFEMLKSQSLKAPKMIDRFDAVAAMRNLPLDIKRKALEEAYEKNSFHAIRTEVIAQLINDKSAESVAMVKKAIHDNDVQVRKSVIMMSTVIEPSLLKDYETLLLDSSYQTIATTLEKLSFQFPENRKKYTDITKGIDGTNGRNVLIKRLEILAELNEEKEKEIQQLVELSSVSYEFITRANAMAALRRVDHFSLELLENCLQACLTNNGRLSGPAAETVKYFYAQDKYKRVITDNIRNKERKNWEMEKLMGLLQ